MATDDKNSTDTEPKKRAADDMAALLNALVGRLTSVDAAGDATVLTMTIAALAPVIQAEMSFVAAMSGTYQHSLTVMNNQDTEAYATVARAVKEILEPAVVEPVAAAAMVNRQPEALAVS